MGPFLAAEMPPRNTWADVGRASRGLGTGGLARAGRTARSPAACACRSCPRQGPHGHRRRRCGVGKTALARALAMPTARRPGSGGARAIRCRRRAARPVRRPRSRVRRCARGGHLAPVQPARGVRRAARGVELRTRLVVVEDAHWADQATLDVLRLLGRRIQSLPVLAIVTYREEANADIDALRVALGDLSRAAGVSRLRWFRSHPRRCRRLPRAARSTRTSSPPHVRQPVLRHGGHRVGRHLGAGDRARRRARSRRSPQFGSHEAFEVIAWYRRCRVVAARAVCGECAETVAAGLSAGMLVASGTAIAFRHEIAREAVERWIAPQRGRSCTAASSLPWRRPPARTRPDSRITRNSPATMLRSCATPRRRQSTRPPSAHTARPPRTTARRCGPRGRLPAAKRASLSHPPGRGALCGRRPGRVDRRPLRGAIALHRQEGDVFGEAGATRQLVPRLTCRGLDR